MRKPIYIITALLFAAAQPSARCQTPSAFGYDLDAPLAKSAERNPAANSVNAILVVGDAVWLGTSRGLSRTTDGGDTWRNYYGTAAFGTSSVPALAYDSVRNVVWASTMYTKDDVPVGTGLRYTTDDGETWQTVPQPLDDPGDSILYYGENKISALPITVPEQNIIYDVATTSTSVYIATWAGGVRRTTDQGATWERVVLPPDNLNFIHPDSANSFYLSPSRGALVPVANLNHMGFSVVTASDSLIYAGTAGGINKSTDGGSSWRRFSRQNQNRPISGNFVTSLALSRETGALYGSTWRAEDNDEFYAVSVTTDGGETWALSLYDERVHNFAAYENRAIAVSDNGAFFSPDQGGSWTLSGTIADAETRVPIETSIFYDAAFDDGGTTAWLASGDGTAKGAVDERGWLGTWEVFVAARPLESETETYAYPNPFAPRLERTKICYSTGGVERLTTIRVFDFGMNYVRTIVQNAPRGGTTHAIDEDENLAVDYWDGRDDDGNYAPNGVYFYRVEVEGAEPTFGKILVVN
jgi:photosystem II stability/assembly factor-like uncharacterized protein